MAAGLHGSARTTPRVRAELQTSQAPTRALATQYHLNPKTVQKWRGRTGYRRCTHGTAPAPEQRPLRGRGGDRRRVPAPHPAAPRRCPRLSAGNHPSAQSQCLAPLPGPPRHLPAASARGEKHQSANALLKPPSATSTSTSANYAWPRASSSCSSPSTGSGQCPEPKFTHVAFPRDANTKLNGAAFLRQVVRGLSLPDPHRADRQRHGLRRSAEEPWSPRRHGGHLRRPHLRPGLRRAHHRASGLTKPYHPWTNGQAERMNRTIKDATTKAFHYPDLDCPQGACPGLRHGLQLRQAPQGSTMANPVPSHLRCLGQRPSHLQNQPAPSHPGTKHLEVDDPALADRARAQPA